MARRVFDSGAHLPNTLGLFWKNWIEGSIYRQIFLSALVIGILTVGVQLVAMAKELIVAASFGTGDALDAFLIAMVIPTFVINVIAGPFHSVLLPIYIEVRDQEGINEAQAILSSTTVYCISVLLIVTVLLALLGPSIFSVLGSGFDAEKVQLTKMIFYWLLPTILIQGLITIWSAVLNAGRRFILVAIAPALVPFVVMVALILGRSRLGIYSLAVGTIIGFICEAVVIGFGLKRQGLTVRLQFEKWSPHLRQGMKQHALLIAGAFLMGSTNLIDQGMAAMLRPGSVAVLNYGSRLVNLGIALMASSLGVAVFPYFSSQVAQKHWTNLFKTVHFYLRWVFILMIPISLFVFMFSEPIIRLIFERGAFSSEDTRLVAQVQAVFGLQIPFHVGGILLVRVLSSLQMNHILIWASGFSLLVKIILNFLFVTWIGVTGIALSTSLMYLGSISFVYYFVHISLNRFARRDRLNHGAE